jgi:hypothetical protein
VELGTMVPSEQNREGETAANFFYDLSLNVIENKKRQ